MEDIKLRKAGFEDVTLIGELAELIWRQHYTAIIGEKQIDYMLRMMYSPDALREQMEKKNHIFYLIEEKGKALGFISVNEVSKGDWFLNKFYIDQSKAAKGIGTRTFAIIREILNPDKITLTVNRGNYKTINFYFKLGFIIEKTAVFDIGNGYVMDDFVMTWKK